MNKNKINNITNCIINWRSYKTIKDILESYKRNVLLIYTSIYSRK